VTHPASDAGGAGDTPDTEAFDAILADAQSPYYVVTTAVEGERAGCLVGYASQCSIEPPRFATWLSKVNRTYRVAGAARTLVVHLLRDGDDDVAELFGGETGDEVDKFSRVEWEPGPDGCPVVARLDWFAGTIVDRLDTGDHVAFLLAPFGGEVRRAAPSQQLPDAGVDDIEAGHPVPDD
jgi:flavin reductase (DIM6/NTAB) family NADH-FMN oxidoreductase RutF